jgi:hypothetical protein
MNDEQKVADIVCEATTPMLAFIVNNFEPTPEVITMLIAALVKTAAAVAIRFDLDEAGFMRVARQAYAYTRTMTREVDAEDDN